MNIFFLKKNNHYTPTQKAPVAFTAATLKENSKKKQTPIYIFS
jgi:hypothetical protein